MATYSEFPTELLARVINLSDIPCSIKEDAKCVIYKRRMQFIIDSLDQEKEFYKDILAILNDPKYQVSEQM